MFLEGPRYGTWHIFSVFCLFYVVSVVGDRVDVAMTCFPPPMGFGPQGPIPWDTVNQIPINSCPSGCVEPVDDGALGLPFPAEFSSIVKDNNGIITSFPSGTASIEFFQNNPNKKANVKITLENVVPNAVITAWNAAFFPFIGPTPHPVFGEAAAESAFVNANAAVSSPLGPTDQVFTDGIDPTKESNFFRETAPGHYEIDVDLDYDFSRPGESPLRNGRSAVSQFEINATISPEAFQTKGFMREIQAVGSSFLREFDPETGFQKIDANGKPILVRSPVPLAFYAIVLHTDKQTHGINPGVPTPPAPGMPWTTGDHFLIGMFDLRRFWEVPLNPPVITVPPFCAS